MYKSYFLNMAAGALSLVAGLMIFVGLQITPRVLHEAPQVSEVAPQFSPNSAHVDYLLLLPPPQRVSAGRAPLPDIRYNEPQDFASPSYSGRGDNLRDLLVSAELSDTEAYLWSDALSQIFDMQGLRVAHRVELHADDYNENRLRKVRIRLTPTSYIEAERAQDGSILAHQRQISSFKRQYLVSADIKNSFYKSALDAGVPQRYLENMIHHYSFDVDFQRDIKKHDSFEILYELLVSEEGEVIKYGDILSMSLAVNKAAGEKPRELYLFRHVDGDAGYYNKTGISAQKALLKTPIKGARLSSGFGYRRHPILGYNKLHKGVDFAAPTGTPILAAGDGTVEYAGRFSTYGKYIRVRHGSEYKTAYAHMSRFADGIKKGSRVEQGQIIGFVGSTGRSTGPHLHYEILRGGKALNPSKLDLPPGDSLDDVQMVEFREQYRDIKRLLYSLRNGEEPLARN